MKPILKFQVLAALLFTPAWANAQSGGQFNLSWSTMDGGGGSSSGAQFTVSGTAGQPDAGTLSGGNFKLEGGFWSGVTVTQITGGPVLKISLLGNGFAVLSWPLSAEGYLLEEAVALSGAAWTNTPQSIVDLPTGHTVTVPASGVIKVFRLRKQL